MWPSPEEWKYEHGVELILFHKPRSHEHFYGNWSKLTQHLEAAEHAYEMQQQHFTRARMVGGSNS